MDFSPESGSGGVPATVWGAFDPGTGEGWDEPINIPATPLSVDYYKQKVVEFQNLLNNLQSAREGMIGLADYGPVEYRPALTALLDELDEKIGRYKAVAETLNFGINGLNRAGAGFPTLKVPSGLGILPMAVAGGIGAAVAVASVLILWGYDWIKRSQYVADQIRLMGYLPPEQRARVAADILKVETAAKASAESPLTSVANITKWVSIAAVAYFAYQAFQKMR
jgi:hypothetical protein